MDPGLGFFVMADIPFSLAFATPLFRSVTDSESIRSQLLACILENEVPERRHPRSPQPEHSGVFESTFDFLAWDDERVQDFRRFFYSHVGGFVQAANEYTDDEMRRIQFDHHCWFHVTRDGGYFQPHNHPNAAWSAIYCVDPGDGDVEDESFSGRVTFSDPRIGAAMHVDPGNARLRREISFSGVRIRMQPCELLIFPSYLMHWVEPYRGERPRVTIAANFWFAAARN